MTGAGMGSGHTRRDFDDRADRFDRDAGLGDDSAGRIAAAIMELVQPQVGEMVLELGAGTGEIGRHLSEVAPRYLGLDASVGMLAVGRNPVAAGPAGGRVVACDCDGRWPVGDGVACCVFASRVAQLLDAEHIAREVRRVGARVVWWITGRARRDPWGYRELLRGRMREALRERGVEPRMSRGADSSVGAALTAAGGVAVEPVDAAVWMHRGSVSEMVGAWRDKRELGGVGVDRATRDAVLDEVERWAVERFGDTRATLESREVYTLSPVRFSDAPG